jgi:hypothetical protein
LKKLFLSLVVFFMMVSVAFCDLCTGFTEYDSWHGYASEIGVKLAPGRSKNGYNAYKYAMTNTGSAKTVELFITHDFKNDGGEWHHVYYTKGEPDYEVPGPWTTTPTPVWSGTLEQNVEKCIVLEFSNYISLPGAGYDLREVHFRFDYNINGVCGNTIDAGAVIPW